MGEVIGAVSAIAALVQLTGLVASVAYRYVGSAKNAQSEAKKLWDEVKSLEAVLQKLQASSVHLKSGSYSTLDGRFRVCKEEMSALLKRLDTKKQHFSLLARLKFKLKWPLVEKETTQAILQIERHKSLFNLALTADQQ